MNLIDPHLIERLQAENIRLRAERLKLDKRIHNQRVALRQTWETVEMRRKWLGSDTARKRIIWLSKLCRDLLAQLRDAGQPPR